MQKEIDERLAMVSADAVLLQDKFSEYRKRMKMEGTPVDVGESHDFCGKCEKCDTEVQLCDVCLLQDSEDVRKWLCLVCIKQLPSSQAFAAKLGRLRDTINEKMDALMSGFKHPRAGV